MSSLSQFVSRNLVNGVGMKPTIILFDSRPGTRSWTCPSGVSSVRVFCVGGGANGTSSNSGGGGGYADSVLTVVPGTSYSYTVGATGGTSSFASSVTATGASGTTAGAGTVGTRLTNGGAGSAGVGGGGAGTTYGNGGASSATNPGQGAGGFNLYPAGGGVGTLWETGLICGAPLTSQIFGTTPAVTGAGVGCGGVAQQATNVATAGGMGGGGGGVYTTNGSGGPGGFGGGGGSGQGTGSGGSGGNGVVGIEVMIWT